VQPSIFPLSQSFRVLVTGRNFFSSEQIVSARVTSPTGEQLCTCSIVVPIDSFSLYCTLESATEFKGFLRVSVFDQTSDATPESSIITTQTKRGLEIEPTLPFFRECIAASRAVNGLPHLPLSIVKNQCNSCCNEACLSAHPKYLVKKYQVCALAWVCWFLLCQRFAPFSSLDSRHASFLNSWKSAKRRVTLSLEHALAPVTLKLMLVRRLARTVAVDEVALAERRKVWLV